MVYAAEVTSSHADELVQSLVQQRQAEDQQAAVVRVRELPAKTAFIGDRGSLTHHTGLPSPVAASVPAARPISEVTVVGVGVVMPPEEIARLSQEVAAKEMELRVLRQQAETTQRDADRLRSQLRDANLRLQQASGSVGTLAANVQATAGREYVVLDVSAQQIQEQVAGFRRRLARMEFELKDKEKDIQDLRLVLAQGQEKASGHMDRAAAVQQGVLNTESTEAGVHTTEAVSLWKDVSIARIEEEQASTVLARERRAALEQHDAVDEQINAIRSSIYLAEQKCRQRASEAAHKQQHLDALVMEERLCQSAAQLGAERAAEHKRNFAAEERMLRQRIADEQGRLGAKSAQGSAYDLAEQEALRAQMQLQALTKCVKEISRALRGQEAAHVTMMQPTMAPATYGVEAGPRPLHALVSPMTISLATPVVVA